MSKENKHSLIWGGLLLLVGLLSLGETFYYLGPWVWTAGLALAGAGIYAIYSTDSSEKWMLIVSYALFTIAVLVALLTLKILPLSLIPTFVLINIAIPFLVVYFQGDRKSWGLLIPVYVLAVVGVMVPLIMFGSLEGILIAAYVLFAIAIPFFVVFARNSKNWWALIPGSITALVGLSFLLAKGGFKYIMPAGLIAAGIWLTARTLFLRGKEIENPEE